MNLPRRLGLLLLLLAAAAVTYLAVPTQSNESADDPVCLFAVGFDLNDAYGTASVRLPSGAVVPTARVEGDAAWTALMQRLALASSRHMASPYEWWHDGGAMAGLGDQPRQLLRRARKAVGLPASADVGVLAGMLAALRAQTEEALKGLVPTHSERVLVDRAMLASPELAALYDEDLADAAAHARLRLLQARPGEWGYREVRDPATNRTWTLGPWALRQPKHAHALFAAAGLAGHLHHPLSPSADPALAQHNLLAATLTRAGLELAPQIKLTNRTCSPSWAQHVGWYDAGLGWPSDLPEPEWRRRVGGAVRAALDSEIRHRYYNPGDRNVTDVLFAGEAGAVPALRRAVLEAVRGLPGQTVEPRAWPRADAEDAKDSAVNGASYGAAMMAWQYLAETPLEGDIGECVWEDSRNRNHGSEIHYSREQGAVPPGYRAGVSAPDGQQPLFVEL